MSATWDSDGGDDLLPVLSKQAVPAEPMQLRQVQRWEAFRKGVAAWWQRYIRGYAWEQVDRLREAKLREIEGLAEERHAAAAAKLAEARKLDAEAERLHAEAEQLRLANAKERLSIEDAYANVRRAISVIEQRGGRVTIVEAAQEVSRLGRVSSEDADEE